jgi:hypothetical protein
MSREISYKDLKKDMLSDKALGLFSEFVSTWRRNTGEQIDENSDDAILKVLRNAKRSGDRRMHAIYLHLRAEFTNKIESSVTECDPMLAEKIMSHIAKGRTCRFHTREFVC